RSSKGPHQPQPVRRADLDIAGKDLRPLPQEGHHRTGLRRRPRDLRPRKEACSVGKDPPHEGGLQPLRGTGGDRQSRNCALSWTGYSRKREIRRQAGFRTVLEEEAEKLTTQDIYCYRNTAADCQK